MSAVLSHQATTQTDVAARLAFQKQLQAVTNKIHATNNIDEIMLDISPVLLGAGERLFDGIRDPGLEQVEVVYSPLATHIRYRIKR